jgi:hypothetical protein
MAEQTFVGFCRHLLIRVRDKKQMGSFPGPLVHCKDSIRLLSEVQNVFVCKIKVIVQQSVMV